MTDRIRPVGSALLRYSEILVDFTFDVKVRLGKNMKTRRPEYRDKTPMHTVLLDSAFFKDCGISATITVFVKSRARTLVI